LIIITVNVTGQVKFKGTPHNYNYPKTEYDAGTQNWGIAQDTSMFMYFANNQGVLQFDGLHWNLIPTSQASPVRSVFVNSKNEIFVGFLNNFGVLQLNADGLFRFKSLKHLLPPGIDDFDEIWKIHEIPEGMVFQSYDYLFVLKNDTIEAFKPQNRFQFSFYANDKLFLHEPAVGLFYYEEGKIENVPWAEQLRNYEVWSVLEYKDDGLLLGTAQHGIFKYQNGELKKWYTPASKLVEEFELFSAVKISDNFYAYGTIRNGVVISDENGEIIQHINRKKGLQNNTVLSLYSDSNNNLWLGLDNGIDFIEINSPVSFLMNNEGLGTGYTCRVFGGKIYFGTNQGLFVQDFDEFTQQNENYKLAENTTGQIWSLNVFDGQLICGHNSGTFAVDGITTRKISDVEGAWDYIRLQNRPDLLLGGHFKGLVLLRKSENGWEFFKKIKGFDESSRYLAQTNDETIWVSHAAKGIFRITLNERLDSVTNIKIYTSENGLPSDLDNIIIPYNNALYISTPEGIYQYQESSDSFVSSAEMNNLLQLNSQLKTLKPDELGNIWFVAENESGVLRLNEDLTYTKITAPFKQLDNKYVDGFEFIFPYNSEQVFVGIDNGFALYSSDIQKSYSESFPSYLSRIELPYLDSVVYLLNTKIQPGLNVPFKKNSFRFHYTAPFYEYQDQLEFSYKLENYSSDWSAWTGNSYKDFTNLPAGNYVFKLKARNLYGVESSVSSFSFNITPPWYSSAVAYYSYIVLFFVLIYFSMKFFVNRMEKARKAEKDKHLQDLKEKIEEFQHQELVAEKEIMKLRNEKLQGEMVFRDKELANQTMSVIQKNKFLLTLKDELKQVQKTVADDQSQKKLAALTRKINKEIDNKQQNQIFETYFDEANEDFFKRLKKQFPQISPREMRLCSYIRMNLTSKEIAVLLNITERGVEISRYRLRKKLELPREINLSTFLSNI
jgi:ligand-binding sensor domain-containing protein/DNA-binding CsgD family transcriptional regulator